jgi:undecaprenyl-diphosphatase
MGGLGVSGIVLGVATLFLLLKRYSIEAFFVFLTLIPNAFNYFVRDIVSRGRPTADLVEVIGNPQGFSFPSGHSLHVTFFYGFLIYLIVSSPSYRRFPRLSWLIPAIYVPFAGVWLIYDGRHWLSDVFGGYIYGTFYLIVWIIVFRWIKTQMLTFGRFGVLYRLLRIPSVLLHRFLMCISNLRSGFPGWSRFGA